MHSYIISGDGDAARSRAREMAAAALCESSGAKPCHACRHCRKVFQGAFPGIHPDVALVERAADKSGKLRREITVDQIRALAVDAAVLPNEADGKVYIFPEADTMNIAAQNAFLKLLEEPPRGVMFLLCAESREKLLETVQSRCGEIRLAGGTVAPENERARGYLEARLDRAEQDTAFSLSTGDEQGPATVLRRKLTDGMQNLFYGAEDPVELDESAAAHTLAEMTQYAQELLGALEKDSALFGGGFSVEEGATVQYASYGSGFVLWGIALSNPRGDTASFLLDDATGCVLALSYTFSDSYAFQIRQNDLWDYLLRVFETRVGATVAAALGVPYDEVQIPMPEAAKKMLGLRTSGGNTVPLQLLNAGNEGSYNDGMDSSITGTYLQIPPLHHSHFYTPNANVFRHQQHRHLFGFDNLYHSPSIFLKYELIPMDQSIAQDCS